MGNASHRAGTSREVPNVILTSYPKIATVVVFLIFSVKPTSLDHQLKVSKGLTSTCVGAASGKHDFDDRFPEMSPRKGQSLECRFC